MPEHDAQVWTPTEREEELIEDGLADIEAGRVVSLDEAIERARRDAKFSRTAADSKP